MADMFRVDGKVAVVMGGTGGIGGAVADGLAQYGAKVVFASRSLPALQALAEATQAKYGTETAAFTVDVTDEKSVIQLAEQVVAKFGTVDILVNAQGLNIKKDAIEFTLDEWEQIFRINVTGTMLACREFGKVLIANKKGKVINFSSVRGARATLWGGNEGYCATKGAVDMITRALSAEWAPYNINVNAIAPSLVTTKLAERTLSDPERLQKALSNVPLKRIGDPADVVGLAVFLASKASDFITGQIIYLDGGLTAVV